MSETPRPTPADASEPAPGPAGRPGPVQRLAAYDRVQTRPAEPEPSGSVWRLVAALALVVALAAAAWVLFRPPALSESESLLAHLVASAAEFRPSVATTRPDEAQAFVTDQLGWAVPPPDLPALALVGVGLAVIGQAEVGGAASPADVVVPAFRYEGAGGESAVVYVYDYITLDRVGASFDLPEATYAVLAEPTPVDTRRVADAYLVTWRRRAMIFTVVTQSEEVFEQVGQAVAS